MSRTGLISVFFSLCLVSAASLDCYKCSTTVATTCVATTTCASGEVCYKDVFRRYFLSTLYTKGCMARGTCNSLANLNDDRYCSVAPSDCTYCCDSNRCNGSNSLIMEKTLSVIMSTITAICCLFVLL